MSSFPGWHNILWNMFYIYSPHIYIFTFIWTSRFTGIPVEATEIPVKRDKLCPYKRNIPVHRDEVKWNLKRTLTRENLQKRKQKETTFVRIYANKISFRFIDKLLLTFPRFFEWNRHIAITRDIRISGNRVIPAVYQDKHGLNHVPFITRRRRRHSPPRSTHVVFSKSVYYYVYV